MPFFKLGNICIVLAWAVPVGLGNIFAIPLEKSQERAGCQCNDDTEHLPLFQAKKTQISMYLCTEN